MTPMFFLSFFIMRKKDKNIRKADERKDIRDKEKKTSDRSFNVFSFYNRFKNQSGFDSLFSLRFYLFHHLFIGSARKLEILVNG